MNEGYDEKAGHCNQHPKCIYEVDFKLKVQKHIHECYTCGMPIEEEWLPLSDTSLAVSYMISK